jgi:peptidoglycan hydrolase-like protein with peptidoglycan-binding domain
MKLLIWGSTGQEVKNLQTALNYHLPSVTPKLAVDGTFGPKTHARVIQFQTKYGLKPDGMVGPKTHKALFTFVDHSHHLLVHSQLDRKDSFAVRSNGFRFGDGPTPNEFPPIPRTPVPFPQTLPPVPNLLQAPRLELDPQTLAMLRGIKWEVEAGKETTFKTDLGTGKTEREVAIVGGVTGTVWTKPVGAHLEFSGGGGVVVEKRLKPNPQTETKIFIFAKTEVKEVLTIDALDLAKIAAEAQVKGPLNGHEPPSVSVSVGGGPEIELLGKRLTIGVGGYFEYETNGQTHTVSGIVKWSGTFHW